MPTARLTFSPGARQSGGAGVDVRVGVLMGVGDAVTLRDGTSVIVGVGTLGVAVRLPIGVDVCVGVEIVGVIDGVSVAGGVAGGVPSPHVIVIGSPRDVSSAEPPVWRNVLPKSEAVSGTSDTAVLVPSATLQLSVMRASWPKYTVGEIPAQPAPLPYHVTPAGAPESTLAGAHSVRPLLLMSHTSSESSFDVALTGLSTALSKAISHGIPGTSPRTPRLPGRS